MQKIIIIAVIAFVGYNLYQLIAHKHKRFKLLGTVISLLGICAAIYVCTQFHLKWYFCVIAVIAILYISGSMMEKTGDKEYDAKKDETVEMKIKNHNKFSKKFYKYGLPILIYIRALGFAYKNGLEKLSDDEVNYFLSYPKRCNFLTDSKFDKYESPDPYHESHYDRYDGGKGTEFWKKWDDICKTHILVNNVDLGRPIKHPLFKNGVYDARNKKAEVGSLFFIKEFGIVPMDNFFMTLKKVEMSIDPKQFDKLLDKDYNDITNEYSNLYTNEVKELLNKLNDDNLSIADSKKLIEDFSKKAVENYKNSKDNLKEMNANNTYYKGYNIYFDSLYDERKLKLTNDIKDSDFDEIKKMTTYVEGLNG